MRATTRLAWCALGFAAFGVTAALAVVLNSQEPQHARLVSSGAATQVNLRTEFVPRCSDPSLRIWIGEKTRTGSDLEFTNVSGSACQLSGYPEVVINGVPQPRQGAETTVLLRPGATAYAPVTLAVAGCPPASVSVGVPGRPAARSIRYSARSCDVTKGVFLRVGAVHPGMDGGR